VRIEPSRVTLPEARLFPAHNTDLQQEVSLCGERRGEPASSVCCKVGQVRAVCCESMEQEELAGRPENRTRQKC